MRVDDRSYTFSHERYQSGGHRRTHDLNAQRPGNVRYRGYRTSDETAARVLRAVRSYVPADEVCLQLTSSCNGKTLSLPSRAVGFFLGPRQHPSGESEILCRGSAKA